MIVIKRIITIVVSAILIFIFALPVFAHPGSLDENGGHYDRKTGEYHYHDGDHTTNPTPAPTPTEKPNTAPSSLDNENTLSAWNLIFIIPAILFGFPFVCIHSSLFFTKLYMAIFGQGDSKNDIIILCVFLLIMMILGLYFVVKII